MQANYDDLRKELFPELFQKLDKAVSCRVTTGGNVIINSEKASYSNFSTVFLNLFQSQENLRKFIPLITEAPVPVHFFEAFKTEWKVFKSRKKYVDIDSVNMQGFNYQGFIPFISIYDSSKILFFHPATGKLADLDWQTYKLTTDKDNQVVPIRGVVEFNPYRPEQIFNQETGYGQECTHINTYKKPEWQLSRELTAEEKEELCHLPPIIDEFFKHLFPSDKCREFIFDWLHHALTLRCETYLVLNGAKGIGKNILSETICKALLGKDNHKLAQPGALESNFNSILTASRMIVFDEFKIDDDDKINRLKRYINSEQMIERKGVDVGKTTTTYNSFIICSNSLHDIRIAWDDRRFSVADMTQIKLEEAWSKEKIRELVEIVSNPDSDIIRQFGYWLLYRPVSTDNFAVYKGEHFYKLCYSSMPDWCKLIIDEVSSKRHEELEEGQLKMMYKDRTGGLGRFPQLTKVEDFLKNYKHEGTTYLGEIVRGEGKSYTLVVNPEFAPPKDNTGIEWESVL